jgi:hypothetical protein
MQADGSASFVFAVVSEALSKVAHTRRLSHKFCRMMAMPAHAAHGGQMRDGRFLTLCWL